jgi:hypothetical protein
MTSELQLKPCPFCSGVAQFCGVDPDEPHTCHMIVCTGCGISVDCIDPTAITCDDINELKTIMAKKWNYRV